MAAASVRAIVGPTAAGKSAVAMWLATRGFPVTIISADSRQVYRGFDVGTAKPSKSDLLSVPHACIDVADPRERFSAYRWADLAAGAIDAAHRAGRVPVVVGGTGLYLRTLFDAGFVEPELDPGRRAALAEILRGLPTEELRRWCSRLDPSRSQLGRVQLLRSLEIALLTGHRLSDLHVSRRRPPRWAARYLAVDPGGVLGAQIEARAMAMLDGPWQREVERLIAEVPADAPAWNATGYEAVRALVEGSATLEETRSRVVIETRQYAKRQRTWFRHQLPAARVTHLDPAAPDWQARAERWRDEPTEAEQS